MRNLISDYRKALVILWGILVLNFAGVLYADDTCIKPVMTQGGLVRGFPDPQTNTCVWRGIPYAEPPVGDLRWRPPQPVVTWQGIRPATQWAPRCVQKGIMEAVNVDPSGKMSEDCLYLNIWRPKQEGKFPVMVWIHGGGYTGGTANSPMYWGDRIANQGQVVLVSINYRLNIFGFLALPALQNEDPNQSTGNYGSMDQAMALKWVKNNIANFGGDPNNITIFGESAGGWSICTMLATPLAKGLFHKAILQSGGCEASANLEKGFKQGEEFARQLGCEPDDLNCLRKIPAKKLLKVVGTELRGFIFVNHHDGYFLTNTPLAMIRSGKFNNVPLIAGSTRDEMSIVVSLEKEIRKAKPEQYKELMFKNFEITPEEADRVVELYPLSEYQNLPKKAYGQIATDAGLGCPTYLGLSSVAKFQNQVYYYRFDYDNIYLGKKAGAVHSLELPFVFGTMDRVPWNALLKNSSPKVRSEMQELSRIMQGYWTNFAKTGNPNGPAFPEWSIFKLDSQKLIIFDNEIKTDTFAKTQQCSFWEEYSKKHPPVFERMGRPEEKK